MSMSPEVFEMIDAQARESAQELIRGGWDASSTYDLATYYGDLQALEERLGRKADQDERAELERQIRQLLAEVSDDDGGVGWSPDMYVPRF
jgi:hypothetical protein